MVPLAAALMLLVVCLAAARWLPARGVDVRCACHLAPWPPEDLVDADEASRPSPG